MTEAGARVRRTYLTLTLLTTLAASTIWGINTLFLLDAGLSNAQAFAANAFFTAGQVLFEVPTGAVADTWGRRASFLLGAGTLLVATLLYVLMWKLRAPMWGWALASVLIGLGFTFFSGATEAWLVDALEFTGAKGELEVGAGARAGDGRGGDAGGIGRRRLHRPVHQPGRSLRRPLGAAGADPGGGGGGHEGPGLHPRSTSTRCRSCDRCCGPRSSTA